MSECLLATIFSDEEMQLCKKVCEADSVDAQDNPKENLEELSIKLGLKAQIRVLQEVLKICE